MKEIKLYNHNGYFAYSHVEHDNNISKTVIAAIKDNTALSFCRIEKATIKNQTINTRLIQTFFTDCTFENCIFENCKMHFSSWLNCKLTNCKFINCDMCSITIRDSKINDCIFKDSILINNYLILSKITFCDFGNSNFENSDFENSDFISCVFDNSNLSNVNTYGSNFVATKIKGTKRYKRRYDFYYYDKDRNILKRLNTNYYSRYTSSYKEGDYEVVDNGKNKGFFKLIDNFGKEISDDISFIISEYDEDYTDVYTKEDECGYYEIPEFLLGYESIAKKIFDYERKEYPYINIPEYENYEFGVHEDSIDGEEVCVYGYNENFKEFAVITLCGCVEKINSNKL